MKATPIENGMQIIEGELPNGTYYCCARYSDFDVEEFVLGDFPIII
jgi:hypothetical protein